MLLFLLWMSRPLLQAGHQGKTPKERHGKEREKKKHSSTLFSLSFFFSVWKSNRNNAQPYHVMHCVCAPPLVVASNTRLLLAMLSLHGDRSRRGLQHVQPKPGRSLIGHRRTIRVAVARAWKACAGVGGVR